MPGCKRKVDEDTWMVTQSKKFKCGQLIQNVYESTLAKLRLGSRNFFKGEGLVGGTLEVGGTSTTTTPLNSPPGSPLTRDIIGNDEDDDKGAAVSALRDVCQSCKFMGGGGDTGKCYFCEGVVCHVNPCRKCGEGFCVKCSITKYDVPSEETYSCYGCLA